MTPTDCRQQQFAEADWDVTVGTTSEAAATSKTPVNTEVLTVVPLRQFVLFPGVVMPVVLKEASAIAAVQHAAHLGQPIALVMQQGEERVPFAATNLHRFGVVAHVLRYGAGDVEESQVVCQGVQRLIVRHFLQESPFFQAQVQRQVDMPTAGNIDLQARFMHLQNQAIESLSLLPQAAPELLAAVRSIHTPSALADFIAAYSDMSIAAKHDLLATLDLSERLDKVAHYLAHRIEVLKLSQDISQRTRATLDERQREVLLREQMATIQQQLGEGEDALKNREIAQLKAALAQANMTAEGQAIAQSELLRLQHTPDTAHEYGMISRYLECLTALPWALVTEPTVDLAQARAVLAAEHYGLETVKERILEFLAVRQLVPHGKAPILCLVGPPGVGKTSLGQSIAKAMQRPFVRVSLGGLHSEAEIRGHRRTYVGALPGNIVQALRKVGSRQCVMLLDELDKLGQGSAQGDPTAAMLEVLDPEQNSSFKDHYLGVGFDLSQVVFIATANVLENIPSPLRDRLEVITLAGYTDEEKQEIARRHLIPQALLNHGLTSANVVFEERAIQEIIRRYTREAGVRQLDRECHRILRKMAVQVVEGQGQSRVLQPTTVAEFLGVAKYDDEVALRSMVPGVATGLVWTPVGGDILFVEAALIPGRGKLLVTGQLGEVMRESVLAALSLVKSRAASLGIAQDRFRLFDLHVHLPAGAIPKDGPSAGVALLSALVSILTERCVRSDTAMTGEISLRGSVLPVGGLKEKVMAAARSGIQRVLLPLANRRDLEDIPVRVREQLQFIWLENIDQALQASLTPQSVSNVDLSRCTDLAEGTQARESHFAP